MFVRQIKTALLLTVCVSLIALFVILPRRQYTWKTVATIGSSSPAKAKSPLSSRRWETVFSTDKPELANYVRQKCGEPDTEMTSSTTLKQRLFNHILVNDKYKMLFCVVPKVACSNWRRVLLVLAGKVNASTPDDIHMHDVHHRYRFLLPRLSDFPQAEIQDRLRNYYKFLFVRNPFERLLSAWRNKFQSNFSSSVRFRRPLVQRIVRVYRNDSRQLDRETVDKVKISFDEFLRFVVDLAERGQRLNEHWERFHKLCHPCAVRYDFVGTYENVQADAAHVLASVHAENWVRFPERSTVYKHSRTIEVMKEYYQAIPTPLLKRVYRVYHRDLDLFGYSVPDFLLDSDNNTLTSL